MKCAIIALEYLESDYEQTRKCIARYKMANPGAHVIRADRKGYLGMAKAYNEAFNRIPLGYEYVWFISNITFTNNDVDNLIAGMDLTGYAAITPCFDSDHPHIRPNAGTGIKPAKFVEFTCPIVRVDVFKKFKLDERMPYDIHDLDWSYRVKQAGFELGVHYEVKAGHTYLRNSKSQELITVKRKELREVALKHTHNYTAEKWGKDWRQRLWT